METTFYNNSGIYDFYLKSLGHKFENSFPLSFHRHTLNESVFFSQLSNNSIIGFSVEKMSVLIQSSLENFHSKRINEIFVDENVLYSCSNDSSVKIWDLNSNKIIKTFKKNPEEIYTISKSKHILAGGSSGKIIFWDLKVMKERFIYNDSHDDDVTKIEFHPECSTLLLAGSLDGILCLFDLTKENEEESIDSMIRESQPIDYCGFAENKDWAYAISTVGTISLANFPSSNIVFSVNAIDNNESNQYYLIGCEKNSLNKISYFRGSQQGFIEEFYLEKEPKFIKRYNTFDRKHIRCCKTIGDDTKIIGSEDGIISIIKGQKENIQSNLELEESNMFMEEEKNEMIGKPIKNKNMREVNQSKKEYFHPFKK